MRAPKAARGRVPGAARDGARGGVGGGGGERAAVAARLRRRRRRRPDHPRARRCRRRSDRARPLHPARPARRAPRAALRRSPRVTPRHGALAAVHDLLRAPEQAGTPLAALAADDHPVAEVCALALALLARLLAAAPAAAAAAAAGGGAALSSSLLQKLVSLVGMGIGAERALESVVDAAPPLQIARQLADALLRRMDQKGRDAPPSSSSPASAAAASTAPSAADGHSDGGGGAAAADEWAASAAEGSVGGGWGVHPDGQRAILLELLSQPRRAERLLVALTPDAAAALPPVGRLAVGVDAAACRRRPLRLSRGAARVAGAALRRGSILRCGRADALSAGRGVARGGGAGGGADHRGEAAVREARGGFAAAFSAQLQLFASVCAGGTSRASRSFRASGSRSSSLRDARATPRCPTRSRRPHALRRRRPPGWRAARPRRPSASHPLVASDVWPVAERRHSDDRRRHGFLHRMLHTHDAHAAGAPAAAPVAAKAEGGGGVDVAALHRTAAALLRPSMMELGMMSPRRQTSGGLPLDTPRRPMEGTSHVLSAAGLRLAAAMARGGLYADSEARSALRDDAHRLLTPPPPGYNDDAAARGGAMLSRAACDALHALHAAARDDALVAAVRALRGADADGAAAAVLAAAEAEARAEGGSAALRASKKGKAKTIGSGEAALRALLIRGAAAARARRARRGGGPAGARGAPLSRGDPRCRRARRRAACGADGGRAARGRTSFVDATLPLAERHFEGCGCAGVTTSRRCRHSNDSSPSPPPPSTPQAAPRARCRPEGVRRAGAIDALLGCCASRSLPTMLSRRRRRGCSSSACSLAYKALTALVTAHPAAQRTVAPQLAKLAPAHLTTKVTEEVRNSATPASLACIRATLAAAPSCAPPPPRRSSPARARRVRRTLRRRRRHAHRAHRRRRPPDAGAPARDCQPRRRRRARR